MPKKEYIEREALLKVLPPKCGMGDEYALAYNTCLKCVKNLIKQQPTADVAEVTYCRDCTHCDPENKHCDHPMGTSLPVPRKDNDFCSYGERKDDDEV